MNPSFLQPPAVGRPRPIAVPAFAERTLRTGLRVIAVRRPSVPRAEIRLRIPAGIAHDSGNGVRARLLPETLLGGTADRSSFEIAKELQRLGAGLDTHADADDLVLSGGVLVENLSAYLDLAASILTTPTFPASEIAVARDRLAQEILISRSQPQTTAAEAMAARLYGKHPYGRGLPDPDAVRRTGRAPIARFHAERVVPKGATMIVVGDIRPERALDAAEAAFGRWRRKAAAGKIDGPAVPTAGVPLQIVDRPGSVQTTIQIGGAALPRNHQDFLSLALANLVFGGYFTSRLVKNIRESKGYTYSPRSLISHRKLASTLQIIADVGTEVTAPALLEIRYELGRMAALRVEQEELDAARRYLAGITALQLTTQAGVASYLDAIVAAGLAPDYLKGFRAALERVGTDEVREMAARYLAPTNLVTVLVGDRAAIARDVAALEPVAD